MWSDEINKKIQDAADSNHPAYTDKAWEDMELLLDKHLPLKKKRRRFIFFLFPLLMAGTTAFFLLQKKEKDINPVIEQKNIPAQSSSSADNLVDQNKTITIPSKKAGTIQEKPVQSTTENAQSEAGLQKQVISVYTPEKKDRKTQRKQEYEQANSFLKKATVAKKTKDPANKFLPGKPDASNVPVTGDNTKVNNTVKTISGDSLTIQKNIVTADKKQEDTVQTEIAKPISKKEKKKTSAASKFSLNFSFGPDISSVGIDNPGKLKMQYGIGAGYALSKRLSIRTGFFAGYKTYTADSTDYKPPYVINNLQKVDADCFVYEIPLTVVYNFAPAKKHNWFISGGVSSYLMKKETYEYYYKNSWGQPQYYSRTYKNKNSHLFSVINISGGYQYHFTDRFSIMAEPYVKIPVGGIGVGKVKLNSAGVLFTVGYKPFLKKNNFLH